MFRKIRRKKQELTEKQCLDILRRAKTATLALSGDAVFALTKAEDIWRGIEKCLVS